MPTYILGPNKASDEKYFENLVDGEVCTNLTYLGKRGIYTLKSGVKIAYLSGVEATGNTAGEHEFTNADIQAVRNSCLVSKNCASDYRGVDVLLTSQWPYGIQEKENVSGFNSHFFEHVHPNAYSFLYATSIGKSIQVDLVPVP